MQNWSQESAVQELDQLIQDINLLADSRTGSSEHIRWQLRAVRFLREVYGEDSLFYRAFAHISWRYSGTMLLDYHEAFVPAAGQLRYDAPVFLAGLEKAQGIFLAAKDDIERIGIDAVYEGKNTGPEASLLLKIMKIAETKLRKVLRAKPQKEREVQEAFENLLIGDDVPYSRETDSIEYSSKTYTPDFTVPKADLAIEIKLATSPAHEKSLIAEINDDILAYRTKYGNLFFVIYDCGIIRDIDRFVANFEANEAVYVRVVKH